MVSEKTDQEIDRAIDTLLTDLIVQQLPGIRPNELDIAKRVVHAYCSSSALYFYTGMQNGEQSKIPKIWERSESRVADSVVRLESVFPEYKSQTPTHLSIRDAHYKQPHVRAKLLK